MEHEIEPFPFFNLPILIQWKILRQYVSFIDKYHVLSTIPQFSDLLKCSESWPTLTKEKIDFLKWFHLLSPGIYFNSEIADHRMQVSFDETNLKISLCFFTRDRASDRKTQQYYYRSFSDILKYLTQLQKESVSAQNIITYHNEFLNDFIIDHNSNLLFRYGKVYKLEKNKCILENIYLEPPITKLDQFVDNIFKFPKDIKDKYILQMLSHDYYKLEQSNDEIIAVQKKIPDLKYTFSPYHWEDKLRECKESYRRVLVTFTIKNEDEIKIKIENCGKIDGHIAWLFYKYLEIPWMDNYNDIYLMINNA